MKQTAVDWFLDEILKCGYIKKLPIIEFQQAKKMEKEQIIDARNDGFMASEEGWNGEYGIEDFNSLTKEIKSEQYYKETFNTNEK